MGQGASQTGGGRKGVYTVAAGLQEPLYTTLSEEEGGGGDGGDGGAPHHTGPTPPAGLYESLDYDRCENQLYRQRFVGADQKGIDELKQFTGSYNMWRWILCASVGVCTAMVAFLIDLFVQLISDAKFKHITSVVDACVVSDNSRASAVGCLFNPWVQLTLINVSFVAFAALITIYVAPSAAGSGIPEIKCFLNGIKHKSWLTFRTMIVKVTGVLFAVSATMPVGKEGPMIHSGAIIGAGLPQAKSTRLGIDFKATRFRNDRAKRDFVSAGAASGVSAAFGAPIGGVLFSLEEGASFWNQSLTWRTLFATMVALLFLHIFQGAYLSRESGSGSFSTGLLASGGLLSFGNFEDYKRQCLEQQLKNNTVLLSTESFRTDCETALWRIQDLAVFIIMGAFGGLAGALWNHIQMTITLLRMKYLTKSWHRLAEAAAITFLNTTLLFIAAMYFGSCHPNAQISSSTLRSDDFRYYFCNTDLSNTESRDYNDMATLAFNPLEVTIKVLLHSQTAFGLGILVLLFILLFFTSCWTYGMMIPSGLFVPALVTGATFGRFVGEILHGAGGVFRGTYRGTYALIGAASFLGGVVRMTISLTVILVEATNEITYGLPIMGTLLVAKWVGDYFNAGIYDIHIKLREIPLLEWESEEEMKRYLAKDVMATDLVCIPPVVQISELLDVLESCEHNGFPVVDPKSGRFVGLVLRSYLITLLQTGTWGDQTEESTTQPARTHHDFVIRYPQRTPVSQVAVPPEALSKFMDVVPYMNPTSFTVEPETPLPRSFLLYRSIGLRHIPVLDYEHRIVGLITRKELTEHKLHELEHGSGH